MVITKERLSWEEMQEKYPDKWLILDDVVKDGITIESGIVVEVCTDLDIIEKYMEYLKVSKRFVKKRTKEVLGLGVIYGENYSFEVR